MSEDPRPLLLFPSPAHRESELGGRVGENARGSARRGPACQAEAQTVLVLASERARRGEGREGRERARGPAGAGALSACSVGAGAWWV